MKNTEKDFKNRNLLLGLGNPLMGDDGLGVMVVEMLRKEKLPNVSVIEAGTSIMYYLDEISHSHSVILVDAVQAGGKPGTIYYFIANNLKPSLASWRNAHGFSALEVIQLAQELTGWPQNIVIYGVEPACLEFGSDLSDPAKKALPTLIKMILAKLNK